MRKLLPVTVLVLASLAAAAGAPAGPPQATDLSALELEYAEAFAEWEVADAAARDAGVRSRERPEEPAVVFWPRYTAALEGGSGAAALWLAGHLRDAGLKGRERKQALPLIVERAFAPEQAQGPWLPEFCLVLAKRRGDLDHETTLVTLDAWLALELEPEARAAGLWLKAEVLSWDRRHIEQNTPLMAEALREALATAPQSKAGRKAGSDLFRVLHAEFNEAAGDAAVELDMVAWRARFEQLGEAGVEEAEVWLFGTTWADEPEADLERLKVLVDEARELWMERVGAASEEAELAQDGGTSVSAPSARVMALYGLSPVSAFWTAFEGLADRDPRAVAWLVENASEMPSRDEGSRDRLFLRLETLVRDNGDVEWAADLAASLSRGASDVLGEERMAELSARWADATTNEDVEIELRYQLAVAEVKEDKQRGVALLREFTERWPEHKLADRAFGRIASLTQLAIGQAAPDIVAADLDGVEFKLSDYRGKVVMLDFWGDW